ncbi:MAG TPA: type II toxin-antitoxin system VapB family antitoxin [Actinophytocola sp.]|uniref:type II toxin-antitoxin system VapB family antitoxin n=1 Tax=Actinophytocola sp. TaxID=1872138 RepID=UPI002E089900|nr:type II toxin-antitoxin system VapB family antitoxin [Actinophytocola sp.]
MQTVIDVDDEALERAKQVLGTTTKVETVNAALRRVAESPPRGAQLLAALETLDRGVAQGMLSLADKLAPRSPLPRSTSSAAALVTVLASHVAVLAHHVAVLASGVGVLADDQRRRTPSTADPDAHPANTATSPANTATPRANMATPEANTTAGSLGGAARHGRVGNQPRMVEARRRRRVRSSSGANGLTLSHSPSSARR